MHAPTIKRNVSTGSFTTYAICLCVCFFKLLLISLFRVGVSELVRGCLFLEGALGSERHQSGESIMHRNLKAFFIFKKGNFFLSY